ncbi:MAG: glucosamine-6-phosphate deaminase [Clostridia bacterium]|nr:glucosamine-6-phosphate deaminase [Clostridia bacterium]
MSVPTVHSEKKGSNLNIIVDSRENIARRAADLYSEVLASKPDAVLGFATGSTPLDLYAELIARVKAGKLSFKDVTTFNLDEYVGLEPTHDQSYRYFMDKNLFEHIDLDSKRVNIPSGIAVGEGESAAYEAAIAAAGGIDMQLLGIGHNGHIGFNEPNTPFGSLTHKVTLTDSTIEANSRFFASRDEVPKEAVTMGIRTVMNARRLVLIALGEGKAEIIKKTVQGPVTEEVPASVLQLHPDAYIFADFEAAKYL